MSFDHFEHYEQEQKDLLNKVNLTGLSEQAQEEFDEITAAFDRVKNETNENTLGLLHELQNEFKDDMEAMLLLQDEHIQKIIPIEGLTQYIHGLGEEKEELLFQMIKSMGKESLISFVEEYTDNDEDVEDFPKFIKELEKKGDTETIQLQYLLDLETEQLSLIEIQHYLKNIEGVEINKNNVLLQGRITKIKTLLSNKVKEINGQQGEKEVSEMTIKIEGNENTTQEQNITLAGIETEVSETTIKIEGSKRELSKEIVDGQGKKLDFVNQLKVLNALLIRTGVSDKYQGIISQYNKIQDLKIIDEKIQDLKIIDEETHSEFISLKNQLITTLNTVDHTGKTLAERMILDAVENEPDPEKKKIVFQEMMAQFGSISPVIATKLQNMPKPWVEDFAPKSLSKTDVDMVYVMSAVDMNDSDTKIENNIVSNGNKYVDTGLQPPQTYLKSESGFRLNITVPFPEEFYGDRVTFISESAKIKSQLNKLSPSKVNVEEEVQNIDSFQDHLHLKQYELLELNKNPDENKEKI
ncbi:MAG: hypothetical protein GY828_06225, partial [Candidatus Gracilibacteria bacterium]|nr:hypothetical protein [Candidatus Gracilibacteria bacterium]